MLTSFRACSRSTKRASSVCACSIAAFAVILIICGATVFTACSSNDDNPVPQPSDKWDAESGTLYVNTNPGKNAYKERTDIVSVVFSNAVTSIGDSAFYNCHISVIDLPASVVSIGSEAFSGKDSDLEKVTMSGVSRFAFRVSRSCFS